MWFGLGIIGLVIWIAIAFPLALMMAYMAQDRSLPAPSASVATTATAERGMHATASSGGNNLTAPAADSHEPPFAFTGTIHHVVVDIAYEMITDDEAGIARPMAQQ